MADKLFNNRLRRGRCIIKNAFGILKQPLRELLVKSDLHVAFFLPNVILACVIVHNILLGQSHKLVENLLDVLRSEGLEREEDNEAVIGPQGRAAEKCSEIEVYLSIQ